jgi:HlyD family secretion protein
MSLTSANAMDRPIDPQVLRKRQKKLVVQISTALVVIICGILLLRSWIAPTIRRSDIRTALVDSGLVEACVSSAGVIVPEYEEVVSSPGDTRVLRVLKKPGERVQKGDQFLILDLSEIRLSLGRTTDNLALNVNKSNQMKLDQERMIADLKNQIHVKELSVNFLKSKTAEQSHLFDLGASSKDQVENARLAEEIAQTEKEALQQNITSTEQSLRNQMSGLDTEISTLHKEQADLERQLEILSCRATREGVWGAVQRG